MSDPDDGIEEGEAVEIDQKNAGEDDVREISCDFFEEHDTEGDAAQKDEAARPSIGDVVVMKYQRALKKTKAVFRKWKES